MSDYIELSCDHSRGEASRSDRPRHVRRLNFAPLILELGTVQQSGTLQHGLLLDQNVAHIPCTSKSDYVRKWIETHENSVTRCDPSDELSQSAPVLATESARTVKTSPIIGSSRKQRRRKTRVSRHTVRNNTDQCQRNAEHLANCRVQSNRENRGKNVSEQACTNEIHRTSPDPRTEQATGGDELSPVLGTRMFSRKRKWKKSLRVLEGIASLKRLKLHDKTDVGVNPIIESDNDLNTVREVSTDCKKLGEDSEATAKAALFSTGAEKGLGKLAAFSSLEGLHGRMSFRDSSSSDTDRNNPKLEIETSDDEVVFVTKEVRMKDEKRDDSSSGTQNSGNNNLSNIIEDTDTQEIARTSQFSIPDKPVIPSRPPFISSQVAANDLNETYCSEAEMIQMQSGRSLHLSAKISQIPSSLKENTQRTNNKSIQSDAIISSITTPSKKSPDKVMRAHLLDSGKKRRKPKRGSMVAKLQSLVNAQISGIRIWHHRMNKDPHDAASAEFIRVLIRDCTERFGNQFLDGILIEDRFNLLRSDVEVSEEAESRNGQGSSQISRTKKTSRRNITIMLVCDIIGTLKMMSKVVINVYPPWNILDKNDLTLEANYISINDNCEIPDISSEENPGKCKKRVIKEFNCPCLEEQREFPFCARRPQPDKPDVMQQIFDF